MPSRECSKAASLTADVRHEELMILQPKRWWFPAAFAVALLIAEAILIARGVVNPRVRMPDFGLTGLLEGLFFGVLVFPIGIPGCLIWSSDVFRQWSMGFILAGWMLYGSLFIGGLTRPSTRRFATLVGLLVLNIAGCQPRHIYDGIYGWSP